MSGLDPDDRELLENVLVQMGELRAELRRLRSHPVVARLSDAEHEQIAYRAAERVQDLLLAREPDPERAPDQHRRGVRLR